MSIIRVVDQNGASATLGNRVNVRLATGQKTSDQAFDDRFLDNMGTTAWPGVDAVVKTFYPDEVGKGYTLYVNYANVNDNYETASKHVDSLEQDVTITVGRKNVPQPSVCPDPHNHQAVNDWFFKVANSVGARTNTEANRQAMIPEFSKCQVAWQNQNRPPMRARFFLNAGGPNLDSDLTVDTGDENGPFNLTFRYV